MEILVAAAAAAAVAVVLLPRKGSRDDGLGHQLRQSPLSLTENVQKEIENGGTRQGFRCPGMTLQ